MSKVVSSKLSERGSKRIRTSNLSDVQKVTQDMGDIIATQYYATSELKYASVALSAYRTSFSAMRLKLGLAQVPKSKNKQIK